MPDELDTMNMLAEAEEDHNMDTWADMAPPPQGWDAPKTPPPPPTPPPCRLSCSSCGYTAPEPEFRKNHPRCTIGLGVIVIAGTGIATLIVMTVSMFL